MRIIGREVIYTFIQKHKNTQPALQSWLCEVENESWSTPEEIVGRYKGADLLPNNRVIFHCFNGGFKLMALAILGRGIVVVEKIGTIAEYAKWNLSR